MGSTIGLMENIMWGSGKKTKCMERDALYGKMARNMKVILSMIKEKVKEHLHGQMEEFIQVVGKMESNMEEVNISVKKVKEKQENGQKVENINGWNNKNLNDLFIILIHQSYCDKEI